MSKLLLGLAALGEAATGLALLVFPPVVVKLLFGAEIAGVGVVMTRVAGIGLVALGIACFPGGGAGRAFCGMLTYSSLATLYLAFLGLRGGWTGKLLWPAVAVHGVLSVLLYWAWLKEKKTAKS